jgi:hypothetical protein
MEYAAGLVNNIASVSDHQVAMFSAAESMRLVLQSGSETAREHAAGALLHMATAVENRRSMVHDVGVVTPLTAVLLAGNEVSALLRENAGNALHLLSLDPRNTLPMHMDSVTFPALVVFLKEQNEG